MVHYATNADTAEEPHLRHIDDAGAPSVKPLPYHPSRPKTFEDDRQMQTSALPLEGIPTSNKGDHLSPYLTFAEQEAWETTRFPVNSESSQVRKAFSCNGEYYAELSSNGRLIVRHKFGIKPFQTHRLEEDLCLQGLPVVVCCMALSSDARQFAFGSSGGAVLEHTQDSRLLDIAVFGGKVVCISYSTADSYALAVVSKRSSNTYEVYLLPGRLLIYDSKNHGQATRQVSSMAFGPKLFSQNDLVALGHVDGSILLVDVVTKQTLADVRFPNACPIWSLTGLPPSGLLPPRLGFISDEELRILDDTYRMFSERLSAEFAECFDVTLIDYVSSRKLAAYGLTGRSKSAILLGTIDQSPFAAKEVNHQSEELGPSEARSTADSPGYRKPESEPIHDPLDKITARRPHKVVVNNDNTPYSVSQPFKGGEGVKIVERLRNPVRKMGPPTDGEPEEKRKEKPSLFDGTKGVPQTLNPNRRKFPTAYDAPRAEPRDLHSSPSEGSSFTTRLKEAFGRKKKPSSSFRVIQY